MRFTLFYTGMMIAEMVSGKQVKEFYALSEQQASALNVIGCILLVMDFWEFCKNLYR